MGPQSLALRPPISHDSNFVDQDGCPISGNMSRKKELEGNRKGQAFMLPPFKDPSWKMPVPIVLTSLGAEFNYLVIPVVKETGEFSWSWEFICPANI